MASSSQLPADPIEDPQLLSLSEGGGGEGMAVSACDPGSGGNANGGFEVGEEGKPSYQERIYEVLLKLMIGEKLAWASNQLNRLSCMARIHAFELNFPTGRNGKLRLLPFSRTRQLTGT